MSELTGKTVAIKISGSPIAITNEATSTANDKTYTIINAAKQILDYSTPVVVKVGGSIVISGFTVNRLNGTVVFDIATERVVTVSGAYLPLSTAAFAFEYTLNTAVDISEITRFGDTYKRKLVGSKFASGTLSQWDIQDPYFEDVLISGDVVVIEISPDGVLKQRLFALLESEEMKAAIEGAQSDTVSFISTAELLI